MIPSLHTGDSFKHSRILFKTAVASIEHNGNNVDTHILFDEGSQRSYITSNVAEKLNLTAETQENISLSTFGGETTSTKRVDVATIHLKTIQGGTIPIRTIIVPIIAAPPHDLLR
jgi:hypothetical protein